jgi:hypothetical protein
MLQYFQVYNSSIGGGNNMIKLSRVQKIILALGVIGFTIRALAYQPDTYSRFGDRGVAMAVNAGAILQCIAILLITALLMFLLHKGEKD